MGENPDSVNIQDTSKPSFFGVKSYIHHFYEPIQDGFKSDCSDECDESRYLIAPKKNRKAPIIWKFSFWFGLILIWLISVGCASTEEECLKKKIWCYDCSTETNPKCGDPFNSTLVKGEEREVQSVALTQCEGCCIKIVKKKDTPQQIIQRTCTGKIQINLFMVDHVCMEESDGRGHMCFCESDACNKGLPINPLDHFILWTVMLISSIYAIKCPS